MDRGEQAGELNIRLCSFQDFPVTKVVKISQTVDAMAAVPQSYANLP